MKKLLIIAVLLVSLSPSVHANDFDYGQTEDGCYYVSETKGLIYSKDASLIGSAGSCGKLYHMSSQWYVKRNNMVMPDAYWNRIKIMEELKRGAK